VKAPSALQNSLCRAQLLDVAVALKDHFCRFAMDNSWRILAPDLVSTKAAKAGEDQSQPPRSG
jgi:hypothetical protein